MMEWLLFWSVSIFGFIFLSISADDVLEQWKQKVLIDHNYYRIRHHVPPLQWNNALSESAQDSTTKPGIFQPLPNLGSNYMMKQEAKVTIKDMLTDKTRNPVEFWYSKIANYPRAPFEKWSSFTQLVWKGSKYLGCGVGRKNESMHIVCYYNPPGNWQYKYMENVFAVDGTPWGKSDESGGRTGSPIEIDAESSTNGGSTTPFSSSVTPFNSSTKNSGVSSTPCWIYSLGFVIISLIHLYF